jgi:intermembrane space import and assembly protein 40
MASESKKDQIVYLSEEDEAQIAESAGSDMDEAVRQVRNASHRINPAHYHQAVKDDGEIDWECPCLQGMAQGPCGDAFKVTYMYVFVRT